MKAKEIRELTTEELLQKVGELKQELFNLRFQLATGQIDNPMRLREVRRSIARAKTILRERELKREQA
ncbi:MAG: large subunit ribosomal protein [Moorella sp. (in: firmicutes)]|jgi:large subunit ribosomal protein L29|uniref:50S ribosomal protein L29 n=1 Tax=unclassified Neomoorella TaxID=2676739 RepID=UPI0010FFB24B|nr:MULTISPECIES: 50S ribosomal protein L29 [unclassified Moorella (in: firmicutes)]MDK2817657.1 large subunit ribosomal protein [Moorella sp. (in: firmicutes)]MDK2894473.1 large subunit ribosomal protein [Moorella sp. (in: firmicutes)]GEA14389.1 50S ribosomal protein L29 [Moorella sp. E308F]GEA18239.1 50S ribosomal protein L29 [Moorella sp. E306M]